MNRATQAPCGERDRRPHAFDMLDAPARPAARQPSLLEVIFIAAVAAVVVQPVVFLSFALPFYALSGGLHRLEEPLYFSVFAAVVAIPYVLFAGIPAFFLLRRSGHLSWLSILTAGFAMVAFPIVVGALPKTGSRISGEPPTSLFTAWVVPRPPSASGLAVSVVKG
jgi:hypothetical protein